MGRLSQAVTFPGAGGHALAARLDLPSGPRASSPRAYALFAHCFTCSKDSKAATFISEALTEAGIAVLRFDFTGLGGSEGEFANTTFSSNVADLVAAAAWLRSEHAAPAILVGHSLGGAAVLSAAGQIPEAVAVATINAPADPAHVEKLFAGQRAEIDVHGEAEVELSGRKFRIRREFIEDVAAQKLSAAVAALHRALIVFHAPRDTVFVRETGAGKFQQEIAIGPHRLIADEPASAGGGDTGPSPYDLLSAALGACTAMTIRLYAEAKKLPLERVGVNLRHDKIHATDCSECETREGRVDRIERVIELVGPLDDAARAKLLEIANKCPVHRTLHSEVVVPTRLL